MRQGLSEDHYHQVHRYTDSELYTDREKLAIEYAERFVIDHNSVDDDLFARLRAAYSDAEVLELTALVAFCMGFGRANEVLGVPRDFDVYWAMDPAEAPE
jgi:alkylhydroperoxidase family enzyme